MRYAYVSIKVKRLSCSVNTLVLPTLGAPSDTAPLPTYNSCVSIAQPNSPLDSCGRPEP